MATTTTLLRGTLQTALSTELNSLANNALAVSGSSITVTSAGYLAAEVELSVTFGSSPTANTGISLWFIREVDGTNSETSNTTPARAPDAVLPVLANTSAQRVVVQCVMPPGNFFALAKNDGTGVAFPGSGSTIKFRPLTVQNA